MSEEKNKRGEDSSNEGPDIDFLEVIKFNGMIQSVETMEYIYLLIGDVESPNGKKRRNKVLAISSKKEGSMSLAANIVHASRDNTGGKLFSVEIHEFRSYDWTSKIIGRFESTIANEKLLNTDIDLYYKNKREEQ